jgi:hypothetical protein
MRRALRAAARSERVPYLLPLPVVTGELQAWIGDPHQWHAAFSSNWRGLIEDVERSLESCGPHLRRALVGDTHIADELRAVRGRLSGSGSGPDASLRRRLHLVGERLVDHLASSGAASAALHDLRDATKQTDSPDAQLFARHLLDILEAHGHSSRSFGSTVASLLNDDAVAIARERGDQEVPDPRERAGASVEERLALSEAFVRRPPRSGHAVVWLEYELANVGRPPVVPVGEKVTIYDGAWLRDALRSNVLSDLPAEVRNEPSDLKMLLRIFESESSESTLVNGDDDDSSPVAYIRVDLGAVVIAHAAPLARQTAEAIVSLASLYGLSPSVWEPGSSWVSYVDGRSSAGAYGGRRGGPVSAEDRAELRRSDNTAHVLPQVAKMLGPKLPVRNPAIADTCTLLSWLRQARRAPAAARLLLCDRVIEQVSGWAGIDDRNYFIREHLGPGWAYTRMRREIANVGWAARAALGREGGHGESAWQEIFSYQASYRGTLNLQALLQRLPWILDQLKSGTDEYERVRRLRDRCVNGGAAAAWWRELEKRFTVLDTRARRTRNALMHGGPLIDDTVEAVVDFADEVAADALNVSLEGRIEDRDLIDHFLASRATLVRSKQRLVVGEKPSTALFWESRAAV